MKLHLKLTLVSSILFLFGLQNARADSNLTENYDSLFAIVTWVSAIVLALVLVLFLFFLNKYKESNTETERKEIPHATAKKLETFWTAVTILVIIVLMVVSYPALANLNQLSESDDGEVIIVEGTGAWTWKFHLRNDSVVIGPVLQEDQTQLTSMRVTVGVQYKLVFWASGSFIHSFYSPELNVKMDVIPGVNNTLSIVFVDAGDYNIYCAEFCGAGHSRMRGLITAVEA